MAEKMKLNLLRMPLDILMTILSIILMGGIVLFPDDRIHQICGISLIVLWVIHIVLNHRWYGALFKGKYQPYRIMQLIVNLGVLICALFLMISGLLMAWFVPSDWGGGALGFARTTHLLASHWYYIFMAFHIGLHAKWIASLCHSRAPTRESLGKIVGSSPTITQDKSAMTEDELVMPQGSSERTVDESALTQDSSTMTGDISTKAKDTSTKNQREAAIIKNIPRVICIIISLYGVYAFITRGLWKYMFGLQQFFFFDFERGYILFALDYISIIVLFGIVAYYIGKLITRK